MAMGYWRSSVCPKWNSSSNFCRSVAPVVLLRNAPKDPYAHKHTRVCVMPHVYMDTTETHLVA